MVKMSHRLRSRLALGVWLFWSVAGADFSSPAAEQETNNKLGIPSSESSHNDLSENQPSSVSNGNNHRSDQEAVNRNRSLLFGRHDDDGHNNSGGPTTKIVGGSGVGSKNEYPYFVSLDNRSCGGFLIAPDVVLSKFIRVLVLEIVYQVALSFSEDHRVTANHRYPYLLSTILLQLEMMCSIHGPK